MSTGAWVVLGLAVVVVGSVYFVKTAAGAAKSLAPPPTPSPQQNTNNVGGWNVLNTAVQQAGSIFASYNEPYYY